MPDQRSFWQHFVLTPGKKVDMGKVLKYPLTPVPLSICHVDGSIQKTPKAALMRYLECKVNSLAPSKVDIKIIDAMFFLHLHSNLPATFGGVSRFLLSRIMESAGSIIHFVSDQWFTPSIKDCERETSAANALAYQIKGSSQQRPSNWITALKSASF